MRYIYYIIAIFLVLSAIVGIELRSKRSTVKDAALVINKKVISVEEFNRLRAACQSGREDRNGFINSLITKELLIQESQREGIDKEESFRQSIQDFYEQSLIKLLMDRKFASLHVTIPDEEVDRYAALINKKLHLTIFTFDTVEEAEKSSYKNGESYTVTFRNLSRTMQGAIIPLRKGGMTRPVKNGDQYAVVRLEGMETTSEETPSAREKKEIRKMLLERKKEELIGDWIAGLREKGSIKILVKEKD